MIARIKKFLKDEEGSNAAEYALIIALIAIVMAVGAASLGTAIDAKLAETATAVTNAPG